MGRQWFIFRLPEPSHVHQVSDLDYDAPQPPNRIARYLSKLCDQVYCLISDEHGRRLVWKQDFKSAVEEQQHSEDEDDMERFDRLFTFKVAVTNEQEETATIHKGFTVKPF